MRQYLSILPEENSIPGYINALNCLVKTYPTSRQIMNNELILFDSKMEIKFLRKSLLSGAYKFKNQQTQVVSLKMLDLFKSSLNHINELIIIGYGFGDIHINVILKEWLEFTSQRSIVIINPNQEEIPNFIRHLYAQVSLQKKTVSSIFQACLVVR